MMCAQHSTGQELADSSRHAAVEQIYEEAVPSQAEAVRTLLDGKGRPSDGSARAESVLGLQRIHGNRAVQRATRGAGGKGVVVQRCTHCGNPLCANGEVCSGKKRKYAVGTHGAKGSEQERLQKKFKIPVSGSTNESEHTIGFQPINQTSGLKRGSGKRARELENTAPAYQEVKALHRAHIGTGTHSAPDASGLNSDTYRDYQRSLLESGDVASAVQLNQLGYAFDPTFRQVAPTPQGQAATDSFDVMVGGLSAMTYAQGGNDVSVPVDPLQRAEMYLSRRAASTGQWPVANEIYEARKLFGT